MTEQLANPVVIQLFVFLTVTTIVLAVALLWWRDDDRTRSRLQSLHKNQEKSEDWPKYETQWQMVVRVLTSQGMPNLAEQLLPNDGKTRNQLQKELIQAGIYSASAPTILMVVKLLLMTLPMVLGITAASFHFFTMQRGLLLGGVCGALGMFVPLLWLEHVKSRRKMGLRRSLPDFLDLIVACLESGMSIQAALVQVAEELRQAHPDLSMELSIVQGEAELGRNMDEAFFRLAERTNLEELRSLATFVQQAQKYGSTMADAMRELSEMLRLQREQRAEEQAQQAAVKILIPTVLCIFPAIFVVLAGPAAIKIRDSFAKTGSSQVTGGER